MSEIDVGTALSIIGIFISIIGLLVQHFKSIVSIKERLSRMETKIDLFWKAVEKHIVDLLKSPHTRELDRLMDKFVNGTLTKAEAETLKNHLSHELQKGSKAKRLAIILLLARLESEKSI